MKKTMMTAWIAAAALTLTAGIVEDTKSRPVLAGTARIAPLGEVTQKVTSLGTLIGNPIVPTLLLTSGQQQLVDRYGRLRADAPVMWLAYVQTPAWEIASTNLDQVALEGMVETVLVYPIADGPANLLLKHPGATKDADGTIHLLPGKDHPDDTYVKYTPDGRFCAFAASPAMAAQALSDFTAISARHAGEKADEKLLRVEIAERGVSAFSTLYKAMIEEQRNAVAQAGTNDVAELAASLQAFNNKKLPALLESVAAIALTLDIDKSGLTLDGRMLPKQGRKVALVSDFALPKGTLDHVPAAAPFFYFGGDRFTAQCPDEATFRADMDEAGPAMALLLSQAAEKADDAKNKPFLKDLSSAFSHLFKTCPFPAATDWTGLWLAFDGECRPYFEVEQHAARVDEKRACTDRFWADLIAAAEKRWPGKSLLAKEADDVTFDVLALVDLCGDEAGVKPGSKDAKKLVNAKKKIETILGAGKLVDAARYEGDRVRSRISAFGLKPADQPLTGEARVAVALPETAAQRPASVFSLELYSLVRNAVLPIMAKVAAKKDAVQYKAIIAAMPPPEPDSAIACACWTEANGSLRSLLRVTAGEIKNLGAAFNAFTAASLAGADND